MFVVSHPPASHLHPHQDCGTTAREATAYLLLGWVEMDCRTSQQQPQGQQGWAGRSCCDTGFFTSRSFFFLSFSPARANRIVRKRNRTWKHLIQQIHNNNINYAVVVRRNHDMFLLTTKTETCFKSEISAAGGEKKFSKLSENEEEGIGNTSPFVQSLMGFTQSRKKSAVTNTRKNSKNTQLVQRASNKYRRQISQN